MGFLIKQTDISVVEQSIGDFFIILNTRFIHSEGVRNLIYRTEQTAMNHKIDREPAPEKMAPDGMEGIKIGKNKFESWINTIVLGVHEEYIDEDLNLSNEETKSYTKNAYFAPQLEKPLIEILSQLPLIGCIMNGVFKSEIRSPTSSATEQDFDVIKNDLFHSGRGMRVDKWLDRHIQFTKGRLAGKRANEVRAILFDETLSEEEEIFHGEKQVESNSIVSEDDCNYETGSDESKSTDDSFDGNLEKYENFRNLNEDGKKANKKQKRAASSILNARLPYKRTVSILPNGAHTKKSGKIVTSRTCSFDSLFFLFVLCYVDLPSFASEIDELNDLFSRMIRLHAQETKSTAEQRKKEATILQLRNEFLKSIFKNDSQQNDPKKLLIIDCESTLDFMFCKICEVCPAANSIIKATNCEECLIDQKKSLKPYFPINAPKANPKNIVECLWDRMTYTGESCKECNFELCSIIRPRKVVVFDIDYSHGNIPLVQLSAITNQFTYALQEYSLKAIIERTPLCGGHFITHVKRNDGTWETYDDLKTQRASALGTSKFIRAALLIYSCAGWSVFPFQCFSSSFMLHKLLY